VLSKHSRETQAQVSPDGRWITFASEETGRLQVMIAAFPSGDSQRQVSTNGGIQPKWRGDGKELYFVAPDQSLMAASVTLGSTIQIGIPEKLFATRMRSSLASGYIRNEYVPAADGQKFLIDHHPGAPPSSSATVVINWMAALNK
jgi:eukaryotic-like serine/threonine-protein kinase